MAKVVVVSANETMAIDVVQTPDGFTRGWCGTCQEWVQHRGDFEDTVEQIVLHIEVHERRGEDE